jgi:hypothetical protein
MYDCSLLHSNSLLIALLLCYLLSFCFFRAIFVFLLILCYTVGFPLYCFILLTRAFATRQTSGLVGWLTRKIKFLRGKKKSRRKSSIYTKKHAIQVAHNTKGQVNPTKEVNNSLPAHAEPTKEELDSQRKARYGYLFEGQHGHNLHAFVHHTFHTACFTYSHTCVVR